MPYKHNLSEVLMMLFTNPPEAIRIIAVMACGALARACRQIHTWNAWVIWSAACWCSIRAQHVGSNTRNTVNPCIRVMVLTVAGNRQETRLRKNTLTCFLISHSTISKRKVFPILRGAYRKNSKFPAIKWLLKQLATIAKLRSSRLLVGKNSAIDVRNHVRKWNRRHKKTTRRWFHDTAYHWFYSTFPMVPGAGLEPAQRERRGILNPLCLPIPPSGLGKKVEARSGVEPD